MFNTRMKVLVGDITKLPVDAVVNAANEAMCGGGGVDGAIHRAAGLELLQECLTVGGCPQGEARLTKGYRLPAQHIIHTVGPVWEGGGYGEPEVLTSAYRSSLVLAEQVGAQTVAFPCISTGVYGYPKPEACEVAVTTVSRWLTEHETPREVTFCCFAEEDAALYRDRLGQS
jgi:O-acetyl-ADP-ribose deacetylase (regulator of RNase III)